MPDGWNGGHPYLKHLPPEVRKAMARKPRPWWRHVGDQFLHFAWAAAALAAYAFIPIPILNGVAAGFLLAAPREFVDQTPDSVDTVVDLAFFTLGGAVVALIDWLL